MITLIAPGKASIEAIADKDALMVIAVGQTGEFVPEDILQKPLQVQVENIGSVNLTELNRLYLASIYGGAIAVRKNAAAKLTPSQSAFAVKLATDAPAPVQVQRGAAMIKTTPRSFAERLFEHAAVILIRESGFLIQCLARQ